MSRNSIKLPAFGSFSAGDTAILKMPIGHEYSRLRLFYSGITLAQMTTIRLKANNETVQEFTATERDNINQHDLMQAASGILEIPFDRIGMKTRAGEQVTSIATGKASASVYAKPITQMHLEVDTDGAASAPVLSCRADVDVVNPDIPHVFPFIKPTTRSVIAGENEIGDLPFNSLSTQFLDRMFFVPGSSETISAIRVLRDNEEIHNRTTAENEMAIQNGIRSPQSGYYCVDPTELGYMDEPWSLQGVQDFSVRPTFSAANTCRILGYYLGTIEK